MTRKSFFESEANRAELEDIATNGNDSERWAVCLELAEIKELWAAELLIALTKSENENVRDAANIALSNLPTALIPGVKSLSSSDLGDVDSTAVNELGLRGYRAWKIRPIDLDDLQKNWLVDAVVADIIFTESPIVFARLGRLLANSVDPNNLYKLPWKIIQKSVERLIKSGVVRRCDQGADELSSWTLQSTNQDEVPVRIAGPRALEHVPLIEVRQFLKNQSAGRLRYRANPDRDFAALALAYGIEQRDFHVIGALLEGPWRGLFNPE